jgi:hypothetical protein
MCLPLIVLFPRQPDDNRLYKLSSECIEALWSRRLAHHTANNTELNRCTNPTVALLKRTVVANNGRITAFTAHLNSVPDISSVGTAPS